FFAVLEAVGDAIADRLGDLAAEFRPQCAAHRVATKGEGQASLLLPPYAKIEHPVQPHLREEGLPFVNEKASSDHLLLNSVDDFVEGHNHGFKIRFVEFESEIG